MTKNAMKGRAVVASRAWDVLQGETHDDGEREGDVEVGSRLPSRHSHDNECEKRRAKDEARNGDCKPRLDVLIQSKL